MTGRDAWLFLTPEVERLVPALIEAADGRSTGGESEEIEEIICRGDAASWFLYLRSCRVALERGVERGAESSGLLRLALVLRDQYLLAPSVHRFGVDEEAELRRLEALVRRTTELAGCGCGERRGAV